MLGASFLPPRFRSQVDDDDERPPQRPGWLNRHVTGLLQSFSGLACTHPIHTIVIVALFASTTYIGLLDGTLFTAKDALDNGTGVDFDSLVAGSKRMHVGSDTAWKWQTEETNGSRLLEETAQDLALLTFVFPGSTSSNSPSIAPVSNAVPIPDNSSAEILPRSTNPLSPISYDTTLAFSVPYSEAPEFLAALQELPAATHVDNAEVDDEQPEKPPKWVMKPTRSAGSWSLRGWLSNSWTSFVDLLKNAETLDIVIMVLGYLAMHLTFISLYLSMKRLGSSSWLATTVLFNSVFAFLFALIVTTKLGVPISIVLLSEGLPFLVVTIGFEKPIILTRAVLNAALEDRRKGQNKEIAPLTIQHAIQIAVKNRGFDIVRDYCIEIAILVAGAASGVQGGLRQFCFLAAWIMFFDCVLLFTFYTSILTIKLEINRIKRHVALRKALEDDLVPRKTAEKVASATEWPQVEENTPNGRVQLKESTIFGRKIKDSSVPKFKALMVISFILINLLNFCTLPFRSRNISMSGMFGLTTSLDPFKVAGSGLDSILSSAVSRKANTTVTVFPPVKFELLRAGKVPPYLDVNYSNGLFDGMGGRVVDGLLKSLEDPVLSKWIVIALGLSLVLNGYLFNAARWSIKDPTHPTHAQPPAVVEEPPTPVSTERNEDRMTLPPRPADEFETESDITRVDSDETAAPPRSQEECEAMLMNKQGRHLRDEELIALAVRGKLPTYALEKTLADTKRAVKIRRAVVSRTKATKDTSALLEHSKLPWEHFDYDRVFGACCESVIGYMPMPLGVAGPLLIDGQNYFLPMATTEGVLVASVNRGCKAINGGGGAQTIVTADGMTRGPCLEFPNASKAGMAKIWLDSEEGYKTMRDAFNSTSRYARLQSLKTGQAGRKIYIRFKANTGDAMGMNMISKGTEYALAVMKNEAGFDDMDIASVSGNYCTDKKAAAINWIEGRGKSVVAEAIIPPDVVKKVLKTDVDTMARLNVNKNYIGSAMAGVMGGFNAHAANLVAALFIACGQDPAQVVEGSNCLTSFENVDGNLVASVSMPSIEVGTIGGGTILEPQSAILDLLGVKGSHPTTPGENARRLACIVAAAVLAGELSLCSALAEGHLVKAHMTHNRSAQPSRAPTPAPPGAQTPVSLAMTSTVQQADKKR